VSDLQIIVHLLECLLGLGEEVVYDGFGELALFLVIVHFEDLERKRPGQKLASSGRGTDLATTSIPARKCRGRCARGSQGDRQGRRSHLRTVDEVVSPV
jgi:hypothetical protein